jgi:hypothetical protein
LHQILTNLPFPTKFDSPEASIHLRGWDSWVLHRSEQKQTTRWAACSDWSAEDQTHIPDANYFSEAFFFLSRRGNGVGKDMAAVRAVTPHLTSPLSCSGTSSGEEPSTTPSAGSRLRRIATASARTTTTTSRRSSQQQQVRRWEPRHDAGRKHSKKEGRARERSGAGGTRGIARAPPSLISASEAAWMTSMIARRGEY